MSKKAKPEPEPNQEPTPEPEPVPEPDVPTQPVDVPDDTAHVLKRHAIQKKFPHLPDAEVDRMARES